MGSVTAEMAFKIRSSKYRHVFGSPFRKEQCYENIRITRNAHDSNFCCANPKHLAVVTESAGGGVFVIIPSDRGGRVDMMAPKVSGHTGAVLDIQWNPFNDHIIASSSEDCTVKLWQVPKEGLITSLSEWWVDLHGHSRRVGYLDWHPTAHNILLSAGFDFKCIVWNVEQAEPVNVVSCHQDTIFSITWNREGSLFATTSKDKQLRAIDPRTGTVAQEMQCHKGPKASKVVFVDNTRLLTTGFSMMSERQLSLWDLRQTKSSLCSVDLDNSCGVMLPYFDYDTRVVFLAGKGDGNIRYYEVCDDNTLFYLNTYQSSCPQRGLGMMPKRGCNLQRCEVARFYKLHAAKNLVEPISMIVPRKSDTFQKDIYPPTASTIPSLQADEWISGQNREPILVSLLDGGVINSPRITTSKAVQKQDGILQQPPTITTYKAIDHASSGEPAAQFHHMGHSVTLRQSNFTASTISTHPSEPASIKNIKRLSLNEDVVTAPTTASSAASVVSPAKPLEVKAYSPVTPPGAEPSTNGLSDVDHALPPISSALRPLSPRADNPNMSNNNSSSTASKVSLRHANLARSKTISSPHEHSSHISLVINEPSFQSSANKIHIRKTWQSPVSPGLRPVAERSDVATVPATDPELKKAYFRQQEEIRSLQEQVTLKDKRIRQLESELATLKERESSVGPGETNC